MKKLMITAAAAAMIGVANAGQCSPDPTPTTTCALVYQVKMTVKTTKGVAVTGKDGKASQCLPGEAGTCYVYRTKDSTKFEGWIYDCNCLCDTVENGTLVMWDSKRKVQIDSPAITTDFINVMGKKQSEAEWAWSFAGGVDYDESRNQDYTLTAAGYGCYSAKKGYFTSFSGNFAGTATPSYDLKTKGTFDETGSVDNCACDPSQIWDCNDLDTLVDANTVAYGTWTIKYNASASKKYLNNGTLKVPDYVTYGSHQ